MWGISMKKYMYGAMLALMMFVPVHGMKRSLEPVPEQGAQVAQEKQVVSLLTDLWMHIFALSNPTLRNVWMKTCRNFHHWASPRNLPNLAKEGAAQLSVPDSIHGVLHYLAERNFEMVRYFFTQEAFVLQSEGGFAVGMQIFGMATDDDVDRYMKLFPKGKMRDEIERCLKALSKSNPSRNRAELKESNAFLDCIVQFESMAWRAVLDSHDLKKWHPGLTRVAFAVAILYNRVKCVEVMLDHPDVVKHLKPEGDTLAKW